MADTRNTFRDLPLISRLRYGASPTEKKRSSRRIIPWELSASYSFLSSDCVQIVFAYYRFDYDLLRIPGAYSLFSVVKSLRRLLAFSVVKSLRRLFAFSVVKSLRCLFAFSVVKNPGTESFRHALTYPLISCRMPRSLKYSSPRRSPDRRQ